MIETTGRFRVLERIGRGGMGMVFKAHDPTLDRVVAVKVISPEAKMSDEIKARFYREAHACAQLNHRNIIAIYELGDDAGRLFVVMEFLDGEKLQRVIERRAPLSLEEKLSLAVQICEGLQYAHQKGIIHRDVKPANIFVLRDGQVKATLDAYKRAIEARTWGSSSKSARACPTRSSSGSARRSSRARARRSS